MKSSFDVNVLLLCLLFLGLSGCSQEDSSGPEAANATASADNHDHSGHDHASHDHSTHAHPTHGPNGGDLIELGNEEFHAELLHPEDGEQSAVTIHVLDSSATKLHAIKASEVTLNMMAGGKPVQFTLAAKPTDQDAEGVSSRFFSAERDLLDHFGSTEHVEGTLVLSIDGKSYRGKLKHDHSGHDHDH